MAYGAVLHDSYKVSWALLSKLSLSDLNEAYHFMQLNKPSLLIHTMRGLGNRLRALTSAMVVAKETKRELNVIWEKDEHCLAGLDQLFQNKFNVISELKPWLLQLPNVDVYNYMPSEGGKLVQQLGLALKYYLLGLKGQYLNMSSPNHVYVRSAVVLNHTSTNWNLECKALRTLTTNIKTLSITNDFLKANSLLNISVAVGLHIRTQQPEQEPIKLAPNTYTSSDYALLKQYRGYSNTSIFLKVIEKILEQRPATQFFVAIDEEKELQLLADKYGDKIFSLKRNCNGNRDIDCLYYALADVQLLAKTQFFVSSFWSSFSELAARFGGKTIGQPSIALDMIAKNETPWKY